MARIKVSGVDASASLDFILPVPGASYFGVLTSSGLLSRDLSGGVASLVGSPAIEGGTARLKSYNDFIETDVTETASMTLITASKAVGDQTGTGRAGLIGNYEANALGRVGVSIYAGNNGQMVAAAGLNNGGVSAIAFTYLASPMTQWAVRALVVTPSQISAHDLTAGTQASTPISAPRSLTSTTMRVGSRRDAGLAGINDQLLAAVYPRALSTEELEAIYLAAKRLAATRSIQL